MTTTKRKLRKAQKLHLERLRLINFNAFDGEEVANLLMDHADVWDGFIVGNFEYYALAELRDIDQTDDPHADQVFLKTTRERVGGLVKLLRRAKASEIGWIDGTAREWQGTAGSDGFCGNYEEVSRATLGGVGPNTVIVRAFWD